MENKNVMVKPEHALSLGYCSWGVREWFKRKNRSGLSFDDFINGGIPAKTLIDSGDHMAITLAQEAIKWAEKAETS